MSLLGAVGRFSPNLRGALWILLSALTFVAMTTLVKHLSGDYPAHVQNFYRQTGALLACLPLLVRNPRKVLVVSRVPMLVVRALSATIGMILLLYTYEALPMAEANALSFTRPLWVTLLAALVLRETVGPGRVGAVLAGFIGVVVIMRPWTGDVVIGWAHAAALLSALLLAVTITGVKSLTKDLSAASILVWSCILGEVLSLPFALLDWRWPSVGDLGLLLIVGLLSAANQICFIKGMAIGEAAVLAPVDYSRLVLAVAAGLLFFGEVPDGYTIAGALVIVAATLFITWREVKRRPHARVVAIAPDASEVAADLLGSNSPARPGSD